MDGEHDSGDEYGDYDELAVTRRDGVVTVAIESTSRFNSLNPTLVAELFEAVTAATDDDATRCVVLRGNGDAFSAGADLTTLAGDETDETRLRRLATRLHDSIAALHRAEVPVVTGVDGVAAGAGFGLAMCGDLVVVREDARLEYVYPRVGLTGDAGSTWLLPRLVGLRRAREIALLDEAIDADRALELGLVTETAPVERFEDRLAAVADRVASGPTAAYGATRRLLAESFERGLAGQLAAEADAIATATRTGDYARGYDAFFGDGEAEFRGE